MTNMIREYVTRFGGAFQPSSSDALRSPSVPLYRFPYRFTLPRHSYLLDQYAVHMAAAWPGQACRSADLAAIRPAEEARGGRRGCIASVSPLMKASTCRQILGLDQHLAGLGAFGRPHDAT